MEKLYSDRLNYPRLPRIVTKNGSDAGFQDDNFRDIRMDTNNILSELDVQPLNIPTTIRFGTEGIDAKQTDGMERHGSQLTYGGVSKSTADDFFNTVNSFKNRKFVSSRSITRLHGTNTKFREIKTKMTPDYSVNDFYLKSLIQTRTSEPGTMKKLTASRHTTSQVSLIESTSQKSMMNRSMLNIETKRTSSTIKQVFEELIKTADGRVPNRKFYDSLTPNLREFYLSKKDFGKVFDDIDIGFFCMEEVIQRVKCYRAELGLLMDKVSYCFRKMMEKLLELTMKMDNERQDIFNRTMEENRKGLERLQIEKRGLEEKLKQYRQLVDIRESEVKLHEYNVHSLENEVKMLHELLKKDYLTESKSDTAEDMKKKLEIEQAKFNEPALALNDNLINLQDTVRGLEEVQEKKGDLLKEMNNILKAMLKGGKRDQMTQVEEGELAWIAKNIYREEHKQPKQRDIETIKTSAINLEEYVQQEVDQKGIIPGVDPLQIIALYDKIENIEEPLDPIQQSPAKTGGKQVMSLENAQNIAQTISDNWNLPLTMIVFLENVTKGKEMANVLPWPFFKKQIYEIYVDRLNNSFELSNSLIATWVPMSEYLCLYFLKTYRLRRMAELKMLEFLVSLRYYIKHWQRAMTFANLCQITNLKFEPNFTKITIMEEFDTYVQYFFLHAFSKIHSQNEFLYDHSDGITYLLKEKIEEVTNEVLVFETENSRKKFIANLQKHLRFYNDGHSDKEGIDIDKLLQWYIDLYFEARTRNIQTVQKSFYKHQTSNENVLSLEDLSLYASDLIEQDSPIPGLIYPKEMNLARAFLYALTSGRNTYAVTLENILTALNRFGIDCPIPFINISGVKLSTSEQNSLGLDEKSLFKKALAVGPRRSKANSNVSRQGSALPFLRTDNKRADDEISVSAFKQTTQEPKETKRKEEGGKGAAFKLDSSSALFAQHFSIIRELRMYCTQLRESIKREQDVDILRKNFEQILQVLDAGCNFLSYPITL